MTDDFSAYARAYRDAVLATQGRNIIADVTLIDVRLDRADDGAEILEVVYDHPWWSERTGYREVLEPAQTKDVATEAAQDADWLLMEIGEPLGRTCDLLVKDDAGVHWWGDGFPSTDEHPDFHRDACPACGTPPWPDGPCHSCKTSFRWVNGELDISWPHLWPENGTPPD